MRTNLLFAAAVLSATAITTTSCEKTLPYNANDSQISALTINSAAECGKPMTATLTLSNVYSRLLDPTYKLSSDTKYQQRLITQGTVQLTVNGSATYPMTYDENGLNYVSDYIPSEGDVISIEAKSSQAVTAQATCTVPSRPEISLVDYNVGRNDTDSLDADIRVRIADPEGNNYYRIIVRTTAKKTVESNAATSGTSSSGSGETQYYTDDTFTSADEVFYDMTINKSYGSWPAYFSNVFDDTLFDGTTRDIALHVSRDCEGMHCTSMEVQVQSLSKDMYLYMKSYLQYRIRSNYEDGSGSFYIYSNVNSGYGIVGGIATSSADIPL